jgi:hypothetical protein
MGIQPHASPGSTGAAGRRRKPHRSHLSPPPIQSIYLIVRLCSVAGCVDWTSPTSVSASTNNVTESILQRCHLPLISDNNKGHPPKGIRFLARYQVTKCWDGPAFRMHVCCISLSNGDVPSAGVKHPAGDVLCDAYKIVWNFVSSWTDGRMAMRSCSHPMTPLVDECDASSHSSAVDTLMCGVTFIPTLPPMANLSQ